MRRSWNQRITLIVSYAAIIFVGTMASHARADRMASPQSLMTPALWTCAQACFDGRVSGARGQWQTAERATLRGRVISIPSGLTNNRRTRGARTRADGRGQRPA
jgi:hypothetical protein